MLKLTINRSSGIVIFAGAERVRVLADDRCRIAIDAAPGVDELKAIGDSL